MSFWHLRHVAVAVATALVSDTQTRAVPVQTADAQPDEAYAVYSEILSLHKAEWGWTRCAVQLQTTLGNMEVGCARPQHNKRRYEAEVGAFVRIASRPIELASRFDPALNCELISEQQARDAIIAMTTPPPPPTAGHRETQTVVPQPPYRHIFEFSSVGFNRTMDRAIVYVGHHCGGRCGAGALAALQKIRGKWKLDDAYQPKCSGWVS